MHTNQSATASAHRRLRERSCIQQGIVSWYPLRGRHPRVWAAEPRGVRLEPSQVSPSAVTLSLGAAFAESGAAIRAFDWRTSTVGSLSHITISTSR